MHSGESCGGDPICICLILSGVAGTTARAQTQELDVAGGPSLLLLRYVYTSAAFRNMLSYELIVL